MSVNDQKIINKMAQFKILVQHNWALGSITMNKANGGDRIPAELFQTLKVLHSLYQQIWKRAMATGLEKVSFHSNPKERQCQRMFKLPHYCAHFTCQQGNAQNPSSQASTVGGTVNLQMFSWIKKWLRSQKSNCQHLLDHRKSKRIPEKHLFLLY